MSVCENMKKTLFRRYVSLVDPEEKVDAAGGSEGDDGGGDEKGEGEDDGEVDEEDDGDNDDAGVI